MGASEAMSRNHPPPPPGFTLIPPPPAGFTLMKTAETAQRDAPRNTSEAPTSDDRTTGRVAFEQAKSVAKGVLGFPAAVFGSIPAIGGMVLDTVTGNSKRAQETLAGMAKSAVAPITTTARGLGAMAAPDAVTAPSREEFEQASEGAGANLAGLMAGPVLKGGMKLAGRYKNPSLASKLQAGAEIDTAKSLRPVTLEDKAITKRLAPEMSKRGIRGTGNSIDKQIVEGLDQSAARLEKVHERLKADPRPENVVSMKPLIAQVEYGINRLKVKGTNKAVNPQAVAALEEVRDLFKALPEEATFDQVLDLRQKLDSAVDDAGGFRQTASSADRVTMKARRGGADVVRRALNELDPELKLANREFAFYRHAADVVERRQLGEVGQTGSGLPGRGGLLDDILAGWAGNAIGGPAGSALLEAANLTRQTRWWASQKASVKQLLADQLKTSPTTPRALLGEGNMRMGPAPTPGPDRVRQGFATTVTGYPSRGRLLNPAPTPVTVKGPTVGPSGNTVVTPRSVRGELGSGRRLLESAPTEVTATVSGPTVGPSGETIILPRPIRGNIGSGQRLLDRASTDVTATVRLPSSGEVIVPPRPIRGVLPREAQTPTVPLQVELIKDVVDAESSATPAAAKSRPMGPLESAKLAYDQSVRPVTSGPAKGLLLVKVERNPTVYVYSNGKGIIRRFRTVQR